MSTKADAKWFDERPVRTEACSRCRGHGTVEIGYALAPARRGLKGEFKGAPKDAIRAFVRGSYDIFTSCKEAAEIAKQAKRPVVFDFLSRLVVIGPKDDPVKEARKWWQQEYNETPEQTWARR